MVETPSSRANVGAPTSFRPGVGCMVPHRTIHLRLKDKHANVLNGMGVSVNLVWNYANATQRKAAKERKPWLTFIDLAALSAGSSEMVGLASRTIKATLKQYVRSRTQHKRAWLRWRTRKSLKWVPFGAEQIRILGETIRFAGHTFTPMHWRALPRGKLVDGGSFAQDSRGRWYISLVFEVGNVPQHQNPGSQIGIDLGLKSLATLSDGTVFETPKHYRAMASRLGKAQRAGKKRQVIHLHAKVKNQRKDYLHKVSNQISKSYATIVVGDVNASRLIKTRMAKSILDAGWSALRTMLSYKSVRDGGRYLEVSERFTSQACSECGVIPAESPKGVRGLAVREWTCSACGKQHDRDVNAARNILRAGTGTPMTGVL